MCKQLTTKILALLLCVAMMLSITACGSSTPETTPATEKAEAPETSTQAPTESAKREETVSLTLEVFDRGNMSEEYGTPTSNFWVDMIHDKVMEELNIDLQYVAIPRSEEVTKIQALMAANSEPDIFYTYRLDQAVRWADEEVLADMTPYMEYGAGKELADAMGEQVMSFGVINGKVYIFPAPFLSLMMSCCGSTGKDISEGGIYNNYGFHGTGLATAADSMAAVKKYVFEDRTVSRQTMLDAVLANFEGYELLRNRLRFEAPKMGNDDDYADEIGVMLLDCFADALQGKRNDRGGIFRAGTGSAMYYIWHSRALAASPDGRDAGEAFGCNYSPSLFTKCKGPVSILKSFSKPHLSRVVNGGPLTMELHDTVFRNEDSIRKVAMLVKSFFDMGGHQLQINAVNRDSLLDAQKHPEKYKNLIVRVWGWSGYFVELDKVYQDHIIQRMEHSL